MSAPKDVAMRVRRADLHRWRDLAAQQRAPLIDLINAAIEAYCADRDADARLGRATRALVAAHTPAVPEQRRHGPRDTEPLVFDVAAAARARMRDLRADDTNMPHHRDEDCAPYLDDGECRACGASHRVGCDTCGGRGYHHPNCKEIES